MNPLLQLARPELLAVRPYTPGAYEPGMIRLNANESPWRSPRDKTERGLNIYPPPRPDALRMRLATHYGANADELLVTRGSSEAIDVLIRGFCRAGTDAILITPPTFDMYRLYAGIQNASVVRVPLDADNEFALDVDALIAAIAPPVKIVFLCTPNNPTGTSLPRRDVARICEAAGERALVVIDEAYHEFSDARDFLEFRSSYQNVVLLRTLSKFVALAGVRCGVLIADPEIVSYLGGVLPPYTFPTPSIELVQEALTPDALTVSRERVALIKRERRRLADALLDSPLVERVYPSDANFLLLKTRNAELFSEHAHRAGILVRLFPGQTELADCVRVTIGRPEDNDRLIRAISGGEVGRGE
jgi:histidinol-phosphate aminotransferase